MVFPGGNVKEGVFELNVFKGPRDGTFSQNTLNSQMFGGSPLNDPRQNRTSSLGQNMTPNY